jgi:hypothetical protein
MSRCAALVADLASRIERAAIWRSAVSRDVALRWSVMNFFSDPQEQGCISYQLPACIALHRLSLAVASIMIGPPAFVAGCRAVGGASKSTTKASCSSSYASAVSTTDKPAAAPHGWWSRAGSGAGTSKVAGLPAGIATSPRGTSAQPQGWAVSLNMAQALTVIALLRYVKASVVCK